MHYLYIIVLYCDRVASVGDRPPITLATRSKKQLQLRKRRRGKKEREAGKKGAKEGPKNKQGQNVRPQQGIK